MEQARDLALRLRALADPARLRLLSVLLNKPAKEACTSDLVTPLGLSQPTVTHHLHTLARAGLITADRRGAWTYYRVAHGALSSLAEILEQDKHHPNDAGNNVQSSGNTLRD